MQTTMELEWLSSRLCHVNPRCPLDDRGRPGNFFSGEKISKTRNRSAEINFCTLNDQIRQNVYYPLPGLDVFLVLTKIVLAD